MLDKLLHVEDGAELLQQAEGAKLAANILTSEQGKRFKQIELQIQGFRALTNEDVQKQLKFTDEQKKTVEDLGKEVAKETQELFQGAGRDREKMAEVRTKIQALGKKAMDTAAKSLTDEQKKWVQEAADEVSKREPKIAFDLEHQALAKLQKMGVKIVDKVDKTGFMEISKPIQDKLAKDLGPHAVKVLELVRNVK